MKPFRYLFDPLCLLSCLVYSIHRWALPSDASGFFHDHFNDLLLIPAALPLVLWLQRVLGLRKNDLPPTLTEVVGHFFVWAVVCEWISPRFFSWTTGDFKDVLTYGAGALVAGVWWNRRWLFHPVESPRFDRLAALYDLMENVLAGNKLECCRNAVWNKFPNVEKALLVGEGHGRFLAALLRRNPKVRVTCVDGSPKMLEVSRKRLLRLELPVDQVEFIHADLPEWKPAKGQYDLIATHFFLDCFNREQLPAVISNLQLGAREGAHWIISDFQIPARGLKRLRARIIHLLMYGFFRVVTRLPAMAIVEPQPYLRDKGFRCLHHEEFEWGLLYSELWKAECAVRLTGGTSV